METLIIIGAVVGIITGGITIIEKSFHILPRKSNYKRKLEAEFRLWKESNSTYVMPQETFRRLMGYILKEELGEEKNTFALATAIQWGDRSLHNLIEKNKNNAVAIPYLVESLSGRGIRVGWRAEYVLTQINRDYVVEYIRKLPKTFRESRDVKPALYRILKKQVRSFLEKQLSNSDDKLKRYAREVLSQIRQRHAVEPP